MRRSDGKAKPRSVDEKFDWPTWLGSEEERALRNDSAAMARATPEQLARLLTVVIPQDRFADGALRAAFEGGLVTRIVDRAAVFLAEFWKVGGVREISFSSVPLTASRKA